MRTTIEGKVFGNLTAVRFHSKKGAIPYWLFRCTCGVEKVINAYMVIHGHTKSCGCLRKNVITKHGKVGTSLYTTWRGIKDRCYNKSVKAYKNYGGRGITMCTEWKKDFMSFYNWAIENGYKKGLSIDRINNDKGYCPENCRWVTRKEQNRNYRRNRILTYKGETLCFADLCKKYNVGFTTAYYRLKVGKPLDEVFSSKGIKC